MGDVFLFGMDKYGKNGDLWVISTVCVSFGVSVLI